MYKKVHRYTKVFLCTARKPSVCVLAGAFIAFTYKYSYMNSYRTELTIYIVFIYKEYTCI